MLSDQVDEFAKELRMLSKLHHKYIVPFYGLYRASTDGPARYLMVTKFAVRVGVCGVVVVLVAAGDGGGSSGGGGSGGGEGGGSGEGGGGGNNSIVVMVLVVAVRCALLRCV